MWSKSLAIYVFTASSVHFKRALVLKNHTTLYNQGAQNISLLLSQPHK